MVDHGDPVGEPVGLFEVLRREQQRRTARDELGDHVPHAEPAARVETRGRLVEEQHRRLGDERACEVETPPHASRVPADGSFRGVGQVEPFEQLPRAVT